MDDTIKSDVKNRSNLADPAAPSFPQPLEPALDDLPVPDQPAGDGEILPMMATFEEAEARAVRQKDAFYLAGFIIQAWLRGLANFAAAQYAENPKERSLQTGQAWQGFLELFGSILAKDHGYVLSCLLRFSRSNDSPGNSLRTALVPLCIEHDCTGDFFGPRTFEAAREPERFNDLARRTIVRWCDWLDAAVHLQTHRRAHIAPACPDPDLENRWLAALGHTERDLASLSGCAQLAWLADFESVAARYKDSPNWAVVGKAMSDDSDEVCWYVDVDTLAIALWPLVKAYNWTYRDLLSVIRPALRRRQYPVPSSAPGSVERGEMPIQLGSLHFPLSSPLPLDREQDFATYCIDVLGLRKTGRGVSSRNGHPAGSDIALRYCPSLAGKISH